MLNKMYAQLYIMASVPIYYSIYNMMYIQYIMYSLNAMGIDRVATEECILKFPSIFMVIFNVLLDFLSDQLK